jgi:hypothetical protein
MAEPKDIPLAKDLNDKNPIDVKTKTGIVKLFPFSINRGNGDKKWCVDIFGVCESEVEEMAQCFVFFKGVEFGGHFSSVQQRGKVWRVTFHTIISNPDFWS